MFFKGYIETKNKKAAEKFKNRNDLKTLEQVNSLSEYAGILAPNAILIDIDDAEQSEMLMDIVEAKQLNCRVYQTTRGRHFLFTNTKIQKCFTACTLACGLTADIKSGFSNSYEVLKFDGKERFIEWDVEDGQEYQELPMWLYPVKSNMDFLTMKAGDGRNQSFFNYILTLQSNDFTVDAARETIEIINKFILEEPLSESELKVILRDDAFKKPVFFKGSSFLFDKFATFIKNNNHIIRVDNLLHIYSEGVYSGKQTDIEAAMIKHISSLNRAKRSEVLAYLEILIRDNRRQSDANLIAFRNGVFDIASETLLPFSHEYVITNKIDWNYNPEAYSKIADDVLNRIACKDRQIRAILEECIGYCFYRRNELGKAFILTGDKNNGKSTFLEMIFNLLGTSNVAALDLKQLGERFKTASLVDKLANIGDDISDEFIPDTAIFKKLVTGNPINVERKGKDPFDFNNYSKFLFSANNIPRIKDKTEAALRRLIIVPFNAQFSVKDKDFDPYIKYKLQSDEVMEYLIRIGIEGLQRILTNNGFTKSDKVEAELQEYRENNNPILGFFKEYQDEQIDNEPTHKVYRRYMEYCLANSLQPMSNVEFSKQVNRVLGYSVMVKRVANKSVRVFTKG